MKALFNARRHAVLMGIMALVVVLVLSACGGGGGAAEEAPVADDTRDEGQVNELPTALPNVDVGEEASGGVTEDYQTTWNNYLRDAIAEQVSDRTQKLDLLQRYENPSITEQNMSGHVTDIELVEDRTSLNLTNGAAIASGQADFDVRIIYANGDAESKTCAYTVQLEKDADSGLWYVINPGQLQVFAVCN